MSGTKTLDGTKSPKTYPENRICSHDGCNTKLTKYNKRDECYLHSPMKYPRVRGRPYDASDPR